MLNPTPSFPLHLTQYLRHPFPGTHYSPPNPNKPTSTKRQKEDQRLSRVVKTPLPPSSKVNEANNLQNKKKKKVDLFSDHEGHTKRSSSLLPPHSPECQTLPQHATINRMTSTPLIIIPSLPSYLIHLVSVMLS